MELARYVVDAVVLEERSYRDVAQARGVSKSWVGKVVSRYRDGGYEAIGPAREPPTGSRIARRVRSRTRSSRSARASPTRGLTPAPRRSITT
jgi:transposase